MLPVAPGRERAPADPAGGGVEDGDSGVDRRNRVGVAGVAGVVEVRAQRRARRELAQRRRRGAVTWRGHADADRVGDRELVGGAVEAAPARRRALAPEARRRRRGSRRRPPASPSSSVPRRGRRRAMSSQAATWAAVSTPWLRRASPSEVTTTTVTSSHPAAMARSRPRRLSTRPIALRRGSPTTSASTASASAIWGTRSGRANAVTSIRRRPASRLRRTSSTLTSVDSSRDSFCSPSRGETSTRSTA